LRERLNPCGAAGLEKFGQALVFEASYYPLNVPCNVSGVNSHDSNLTERFNIAKT
jgi:hypothetical protein